MAGTTFILTHTDPLEAGGTASPTRGGKVLLRRFINFLMGCISGTKRVTGFQIFPDGATPVAASGTVTCASVAGADTVSINGVAMTATQANARGTVTLSSVSAADTVTINGVVFTAVNGSPTGAQFDMSGTDTADAATLVTAINANATLSGVVTATSAAGVVTIRAVTAGTGGNSITLASSNGGRLAVSGANLSGGAAVAANQFDFGGSDTQTATALAAAINASTSSLVQYHVTASSSAGVVTVTAAKKGIGGNCITWVSSNGTRLAVSGSGRLASGAGGAVTGQTVTL